MMCQSPTVPRLCSLASERIPLPLQVKTWCPVGNLSDQMADFFIGGAHRLSDLRYAAGTASSHEHATQRYLTKFGFTTRNSGSVQQTDSPRH